jgi:limonene-1,2-epoxide hydrolase
MGKAIQIVDKFLNLTNNKKDITGAANLMADDITFVGPAIQISGAKEYVALLEKFLSCHAGWEILKQFENGDDVCVIDKIIVTTPMDGAITLSLAEWFKVSGGKIHEHRVYYDPREFMKAFGM